MIRPLRNLAVLCGLTVLLLGRPARADGTLRQASSDVRITVGTGGVATVEHALGARIFGGRLSSFDLVGVEKNIQPDGPVQATTEDGRTSSGHLAAIGGRTLRVYSDDPKGFRRGQYTFVFRYKVDLVAEGELVRQEPLWHLVWTSPQAHDSHDGARVVFVLPAAPTEPRVSGEDGTAGVFAALRRSSDHDELELTRPHVSREQPIVWGALVDPKAFRELNVAKQVNPARVQVASNALLPTLDRTVLVVLALALGGSIAALGWQHSRGVASLSEAKAISMRPWLAIPRSVRLALAALMFAGGFVLQRTGPALMGTVAVIACASLLAYRRPIGSALAAPRGPGAWKSLNPTEAFRRSNHVKSHVFDVTTTLGKATFAVALVGLVALAFVLQSIDLDASYLVPLDTIVLLPIFWTGGLGQLPPVGPAVKPLEVCYAKLRTHDAVTVAMSGRFPVNEANPDEVRLVVLPRHPAEGLLAIEVGVVSRLTPTGHEIVTEVLVRFRATSPALDRWSAYAGLKGKTLPGRGAGEVVVRLIPRYPTRSCLVRLVLQVARELGDRRRTRRAAWTGEERRRPAMGIANAA